MEKKDFNIEPVNSLDSLILIQPHTIVLHNIYKCMAKFSEPMRTLQKPQEKIIEILFDFDRCFLFMLRNRNGNSMKNFSKNFHQSLIKLFVAFRAETSRTETLNRVNSEEYIKHRCLNMCIFINSNCFRKT